MTDKKTESNRLIDLVENIAKSIYLVEPIEFEPRIKEFLTDEGIVHYLAPWRRLPYYWDEPNDLNIEQFIKPHLKQLEDRDKNIFRARAKKAIDVMLDYGDLLDNVKNQCKAKTKRWNKVMAKTASECSCPTFRPKGYYNVAADDDERKQFDAEVRREMQALGIIS
jgi:hypothetical protein